MVVSEPGLENLSAVYQAFCKTWLSLLCPKQRPKGTEVSKRDSVNSEMIATTSKETRKQRSAFTQQCRMSTKACAKVNRSGWTLYRPQLYC